MTSSRKRKFILLTDIAALIVVIVSVAWSAIFYFNTPSEKDEIIDIIESNRSSLSVLEKDVRVLTEECCNEDKR